MTVQCSTQVFPVASDFPFKSSQFYAQDKPGKQWKHSSFSDLWTQRVCLSFDRRLAVHIFRVSVGNASVFWECTCASITLSLPCNAAHLQGVFSFIVNIPFCFPFHTLILPPQDSEESDVSYGFDGNSLTCLLLVTPNAPPLSGCAVS